MVDPTTQFLYVLQNEFGFIKIGRSVDVTQRINALRSGDGCDIHVVELYESCGDLEEWLHIEMEEYRVVGEWFSGTDEARGKLAELLATPDMDWQRPYDLEAARSWLDNLDEIRGKRATKHLIGKQIGILRGQTEGSEALDWRVLFAWRLAVTGEFPLVIPQRVKGKRNEWRQMWCDPKPDEKEDDVGDRSLKLRLLGYDPADLVPLPPFTTEVSAALQLWPQKIKPEEWQGNAIECCIEALTALRGALPIASMRRSRIKGD